MKKQYIDKAAVVAEIERRIAAYQKNFDKADNKIARLSTDGRMQSLKELLPFLDTIEVKEMNTLISDSRKANRAKFIKELKQKIDSYERELSKSGDTTKCDDVDWVTLASDMFDMLQKCLMNY